MGLWTLSDLSISAIKVWDPVAYFNDASSAH